MIQLVFNSRNERDTNLEHTIFKTELQKFTSTLVLEFDVKCWSSLPEKAISIVFLVFKASSILLRNV